jgi:predicted transcriptional regulator of viral defense system
MAEAGREDEEYGGFPGPPPGLRPVVELAVTQHGVVALEQLVRLGFSKRSVQSAAALGRLHRAYRGVYALTPCGLLRREGRYMAAVLACGPDAALSHRSAAALLELRAGDQQRIDVSVAGRSTRGHRGISVHRSRTLTAAADIHLVRGIPCTTVARTLLDLADVIDRRALERAFDQAEIQGVLRTPALEAVLARNSTRRAAQITRSVLEEHYIGSTPTWSELEERFLALLDGACLPRPEINAWVLLSDHGPPLRCDFVWRAQRLVIEADGHRTHRTRQAFERDRRNDRRLVMGGWTPLRITWRQVAREGGELAATVSRLLGL